MAIRTEDHFFLFYFCEDIALKNSVLARAWLQ